MAALRALRLPLANIRSPSFQPSAPITSLRSLCYSSPLSGMHTLSLAERERERGLRMRFFSRTFLPQNLRDSTALVSYFQSQNLVMPTRAAESSWREWLSTSSRLLVQHTSLLIDVVIVMHFLPYGQYLYRIGWSFLATRVIKLWCCGNGCMEMANWCNTRMS